MAFSVNKAILVGNLTRDAELRYTKSGTALTTFVVATNRRYKANNEWQDEATFHRVVVWGKFGEWLANELKQGDRVYVSGRIQKREYEKDGHKRRSVEIVADEVVPMYKKDRVDDSKPATEKDVEEVFGADGKEEKTEEETEKTEEVEETGGKEDVDPDDIPF